MRSMVVQVIMSVPVDLLVAACSQTPLAPSLLLTQVTLLLKFSLGKLHTSLSLLATKAKCVVGVQVRVQVLP